MINKFLKTLLIVILIICELKYSKCFKWISLKYGDSFPENAVSFNEYRGENYVGRTPYLNTWQIVEIPRNDDRKAENALAIIYSTKIIRHQFEVLVATEQCEWITFDNRHVPENLVRGGTAWNLEPIYIGREDSHLASIFLTSNKIQSRPNDPYERVYLEALICDNLHQWVDATSLSVPENSVRTGDGDGYVARVLGGHLHVPGIVYPKTNETSIWYDNNKLESFNIEVLVGQPQQYKWKNMKPKTGIPENAVVCGVSEYNELTYIAMKHDPIYGTKVFPITFSGTFFIEDLFKILVETVK